MCISTAPCGIIFIQSCMIDHDFRFPNMTRDGFRSLMHAATDGLWDNIYDDDIVSLLSDDSSASVDDMASIIAEKAYKNSMDTQYLSPYIKEARKQGYGT